MKNLISSLVLVFYFSSSSFAQGPIAHWNFNGNTTDNSGNGMHATAHNCTPAAGINGAPGTAYLFDGSSSYMEVAYHPAMNLSKFTIVATVQIHGFYDNQCQSERILHRGPEFSSGTYGLELFDNAFDGNDCAAFDSTKFTFSVKGPNAVSTPAWQYNPTIISHTWYRTVVTFDSLDYRIYVDGQLLKVVPSTGDPVGTSTDGIVIGRNYSNFGAYPFWFDGLMDDLQLYNRVLDSTEIATLNPTDVETLLSSGIRLYPNPSSGNVTLEFADHSKIATVSISDIVGRTVYATKNIQPMLNVQTELPTGVYSIKVLTTTGSVLADKIVIR